MFEKKIPQPMLECAFDILILDEVEDKFNAP